jgi:hypothetical protein
MTAKSSATDKRSSVCGLKNLFSKIVDDKEFSLGLTESNFKSQSDISKLDIPEKSIIPMSLNTLKAVADEYLDGGWEALDRLRKTALNTVRKASINKGKPSRGSVNDLKSQLEASKKESQNFLNEIGRFADQYKNLLEVARIEASQNANFSVRFKNHQERYSSQQPRLALVKP